MRSWMWSILLTALVVGAIALFVWSYSGRGDEEQPQAVGGSGNAGQLQQNGQRQQGAPPNAQPNGFQQNGYPQQPGAQPNGLQQNGNLQQPGTGGAGNTRLPMNGMPPQQTGPGGAANPQTNAAQPQLNIGAQVGKIGAQGAGTSGTQPKQ